MRKTCRTAKQLLTWDPPIVPRPFRQSLASCLSRARNLEQSQDLQQNELAAADAAAVAERGRTAIGEWRSKAILYLMALMIRSHILVGFLECTLFPEMFLHPINTSAFASCTMRERRLYSAQLAQQQFSWTGDSLITFRVNSCVLMFVSTLARQSQPAKAVSTARGAGSRVTRTRKAGQENQVCRSYAVVGFDDCGMATFCDSDLANWIPERIKCDLKKHFHDDASATVASVVPPLLNYQLDYLHKNQLRMWVTQSIAVQA